MRSDPIPAQSGLAYRYKHNGFSLYISPDAPCPSSRFRLSVCPYANEVSVGPKVGSGWWRAQAFGRRCLIFQINAETCSIVNLVTSLPLSPKFVPLAATYPSRELTLPPPFRQRVRSHMLKRAACMRCGQGWSMRGPSCWSMSMWTCATLFIQLVVLCLNTFEARIKRWWMFSCIFWS